MIKLRMCICCRGRFHQNTLIRLQCIDKILQRWNGSGRSFYLCKECLLYNKKLLNSIYKECKNKEKSYETKIQELKDIWIK